jgi:methionyl-tRNA formyltransferase
MVEVLADLARYPPVPQPEEGVTLAPKIDKVEARLDFTRTAIEVERQVRAFNPAPGAFFELGGERIRVVKATLYPREGGGPEPQAVPSGTLDPRLRGGTVVDDALTIACADGAIRPTLVQRAGRGVMTPAELLRGFPIPAGTQL